MTDQQSALNTLNPAERRCPPTQSTNKSAQQPRTLLTELPAEVLHEIAGHLCDTKPGAVLISQPQGGKDCCAQASSDGVFPSQTKTGPNKSLLTLASINKRMRKVLFSLWLLRSIVFKMCGEQWNRLKCLSSELRSDVRSLVIITKAELHTGNHDPFNHADVIRLFPNVDEVSIITRPLSEDDSRYAALGIGAHDSQEDPILSLDPIIGGVISLSISVLDNEYLGRLPGRQDAIRMKQLHTILQQLHLPEVQSLGLKFDSPLSFVDWPTVVHAPSSMSFPALEELNVQCPVLIGQARELDICAGADRILSLFDSSSNISKIDVRMVVTIPAEATNSAFWQPGVGAGGNVNVMPGVLPSVQEAINLLAAQKQRHPDLCIFSVDVRLAVLDCFGYSTGFDFWHFCYPGTVADSSASGKSVTPTALPYDGQLAVLSVSHKEVNMAVRYNSGYVDDMLEASYWEYGSGLLR